MSFERLPLEVKRQIFLEAVESRAIPNYELSKYRYWCIRRALRLRLVSPFWSQEIRLAIFDAHILEELGVHNPWDRHIRFLSEYRLYDNLHRNLSVFDPSQGIRRAVELAEEYHGVSIPEDELTDLVDHFTGFVTQHDQLVWPSPTQAMLCIAAYMNDVKFAKEILLLPAAKMEELRLYGAECPNSTMNGHDHYPVLGYPLEAAAMKGHVEMTRWLLKQINVKDITREERTRIYTFLVRHALKADQPHTLKIGLKDGGIKLSDCIHRWRYVSGIGIEVFKHLPAFTWKKEPHGGILLTREFLLRQVASSGDIPGMEYFIRQGTSPKPKYPESFQHQPAGLEKMRPIGHAILKGHYDAVVYLLQKRAVVTPELIDHAARFGSERLLRLLLQHHGGTGRDMQLDAALASALERENDSVIALLIEHGASLSGWSRREAMSVARYEGEETMVNIIKKLPKLRRKPWVKPIRRSRWAKST